MATAYAGVTALLSGLDRHVTLGHGGSLSGRAPFATDAAYADAARSAFGTSVRVVPDPRGELSVWGRTQGGGTVAALGEVAPHGAARLGASVGAVRAAWRFRVNRSSGIGGFLPDSADRIEADFLVHRAAARTLRTEELIAADIPYGNGAFGLLLLAPRYGEYEAVDALVARLDTALLGDVARRLIPAAVSGVVFPTFALQPTADLAPALRATGIARIFSGSAELPRLAPSGGFAAFAHAGLIEAKRGGLDNPFTPFTVSSTPPPQTAFGFSYNRPFVFLVRERFTGAVLFAGVVRVVPVSEFL
jgi:serpin B